LAQGLLGHTVPGKLMKRDKILGIQYDNITITDAMRKVEQFFRDDKSYTVAFLSTISLMTAKRNKNLRILLEETDLIIPGGSHIFWAAQLLHRPLKELIEPSIFIKLLLRQSVKLNKRVWLFGGKNDTVDKAYYNLKKDIPNLFVVGRYKGNNKPAEHENVLKAIGKASPHYFFIGLGSPYEQIWLSQNRNKINSKVAICIEDTFSLFAGEKKFRIKRDLNRNKVLKREIPHPAGFKKLWIVPLFIISVFIERFFWKK